MTRPHTNKPSRWLPNIYYINFARTAKPLNKNFASSISHGELQPRRLIPPLLNPNHVIGRHRFGRSPDQASRLQRRWRETERRAPLHVVQVKVQQGVCDGRGA
ncbi:hypothetical protein QQ045_030878 [Rhodiola kirilowii]